VFAFAGIQLACRWPDREQIQILATRIIKPTSRPRPGSGFIVSYRSIEFACRNTCSRHSTLEFMVPELYIAAVPVPKERANSIDPTWIEGGQIGVHGVLFLLFCS
jgi:hypothetical protein